jgi:hypothetical protein
VIAAFVGIAMYLALVGLSAGVAAYVFNASATVVKVVALVGGVFWLYVVGLHRDRIIRWVDRWVGIGAALADKIDRWRRW